MLLRRVFKRLEATEFDGLDVILIVQPIRPRGFRSLFAFELLLFLGHFPVLTERLVEPFFLLFF